MTAKEYVNLSPSERQAFAEKFPASASRFAHLDSLPADVLAFSKMPPMQRHELSQEDPETYAELRAAAQDVGLL